MNLHTRVAVTDHGVHYWSTDEGSTFSSVKGALAYGCEVHYTDTPVAAGDSECVIMVRAYRSS
jgi:hypothetical protein